MTFQELDNQATRLGRISLRRRLEPTLGMQVYEVKLDDEFLMSSLFTAAEIALATLALERLHGDVLDVAVGGLGLGYTASAVLADARIRTLDVIEVLPEVVEWHRRHLVPLGEQLSTDARCRLVTADFFETVGAGVPLGGEHQDNYDAILVDIDHSPSNLLHPGHANFYEPAGFAGMARVLRPGGIFGLWADGLPDDDVVQRGRQVLASFESHVVTFPNHYTGDLSSSTVYLGGLP